MILQRQTVFGVYQLDETAVMRAAQTDMTAFAPLYEHYFPRIYAYCQRRVSEPQDAEDLTSFIFTQAVANLAKFRGGSVAAWLFKIAHNVVINHLRNRRVSFSLDGLEIPIDDIKPLDRIVAAEESAIIRKLVDSLPEAQRDLLALKLAAGLNAKEIGEVIGKSAGAVRVEIHRIITKLREAYLQEGNYDE